MELEAGFSIDDPKVFVPWEISEDGLRRLLKPFELRRVTKKYYVLRVSVCAGLRCNLGFHFRGPNDALSELEFFRDAYPDPAASFAEFQQHFEFAFGKPSMSRRN
jgi:hypothetical protein